MVNCDQNRDPGFYFGYSTISTEFADSCPDFFVDNNYLVIQESHDPFGRSTFLTFALDRREKFLIHLRAISTFSLSDVALVQYQDGLLVAAFRNGTFRCVPPFLLLWCANQKLICLFFILLVLLMLQPERSDTSYWQKWIGWNRAVDWGEFKQE